MNTKPKLSIFMQDLAGGGAERAMVQLAGQIAEEGYPVDMVLFRAQGPYLKQISSHVRIVDLQARHMLLSLPSLLRYLEQEKPAALLSCLNQPNVVASWAKRRTRLPIRFAMSVQNHLSTEAQLGKSLRLKLMPAFVRRFCPVMDAITAVSDGVSDDLAQVMGVPRSRVTTIYNPVISEQTLVKAQEPLDHPWFAEDQPPVILAVGRLTLQKNYPVLLRAFAQLRARRPARLMILGEGEDRAALEALATELKIQEEVALPGFVQNPFAYMSHAAVYALASRFEGLPTVLIEALACGTPVVSTDCPSGPFEILQGGRYGELVPVGDVEALACALEKTLAQPNRPPEESWKPYLAKTVTAHYLKLLLPE